MSETIRMFVNGQAMRGGSLHDALASSAKFVGEVRTAPHYRFFSVRNEFPSLYRAQEGHGAAIAGEVYESSYQTLREGLLPREPDELELSVIQLEDGSGSLSMVMREGSLDLPGVHDITEFGGWRTYREGWQATP
jgi:gamma-glutamylcyclotransferase (GGCT)/AIG2-like uncharacterized protein YtfP